jgi:hypothetical protein
MKIAQQEWDAAYYKFIGYAQDIDNFLELPNKNRASKLRVPIINIMESMDRLLEPILFYNSDPRSIRKRIGYEIGKMRENGTAPKIEGTPWTLDDLSDKTIEIMYIDPKVVDLVQYIYGIVKKDGFDMELLRGFVWTNSRAKKKTIAHYKGRAFDFKIIGIDDQRNAVEFLESNLQESGKDAYVIASEHYIHVSTYNGLKVHAGLAKEHYCAESGPVRTCKRSRI